MKVRMLKTCGDYKGGTVCEVPDWEARRFIEIYGTAVAYVEPKPEPKPTRTRRTRKADDSE